MATSSLYGNSSESIGLYGIGSASGGTYFEWFIFYDSATAPATPTGGSWSFTTNTGTAPTDWLNAPPASPSNLIWVSIAIVDSRSTAALTWSVPGLMAASGLPILTGSGVPSSGTGVNGQLYINTATTPQSMYNKQSGSWVQITGSNLVDLVNNQTIGGIKTFSSSIVGSVTGTAGNVSGVVAIANGGTNASTASAARTNLGLGTISTQDASSVAITGGSITGITDLAIADGGTGASTATNARTNLGAVGLTDTQTLTNKTISGASNTLTNIGNSSLTNSSVTINGSGISLGGTATITAATPNNLVFGSGLSATGNFNGSVATNVTLANVGTAATYGDSGTIPVFTTNAFGQISSVSLQSVVVDSTDISGTIAIAQGGTGASSAANARINLLPSYAGNGGKVFALNAGATDVEWRAVSGTGTVSSVAVSGGSTGLTTSGGPITAAGTITIGGTLAVGSGGTGVTASSGANSVVLRDANGNVAVNVLSEGFVNVAAAGTTTVLTASSAPSYCVTGSGGQTYQLPDATTLTAGTNYFFNNNQSSGTIVVKNNSSTTIATIQSGGYVEVLLLVATPAAGTWDVHNYAPSNVSWSTNTFDYPGSITSATWNGATVATNRGGTGLTSFTSGGVVYASSTSALATGSALTFNGTNLGVGTASPTSDAITQFINVSNATSAGIVFTAARKFSLYSSASSTLVFRDETAGTSRMVLDSSGNLGIGTTSPGAKVDATGTYRLQLRTDDTVPEIRAITSSGAAFKELGINGLDLRFITSNTERARIDSSGNLMVGTTSPIFNTSGRGTVNVNGTTDAVISLSAGGSTATAAYLLYDGTNTTIQTVSNGYTRFGTNNAERARITAAGELLVGLTSATGVAKLQVSGALKTTGFTVATLPTGTVGMRTYVTDALAPTFGATVVTGGAVTIPVFYNGTNWIVC